MNTSDTPTWTSLRIHYKNPVIRGDWSDPGVVRVDGDYYSVRSTFGWQPGLHIAHSKDLVHWRYIGFADTANAFGRPHGICEGGIWGSDIGWVGCGRDNVWTGTVMGVFACRNGATQSRHADVHQFRVVDQEHPDVTE